MCDSDNRHPAPRVKLLITMQHCNHQIKHRGVDNTTWEGREGGDKSNKIRGRRAADSYIQEKVRIKYRGAENKAKIVRGKGGIKLRGVANIKE